MKILTPENNEDADAINAAITELQHKTDARRLLTVILVRASLLSNALIANGVMDAERVASWWMTAANGGVNVPEDFKGTVMRIGENGNPMKPN